MFKEVTYETLTHIILIQSYKKYLTTFQLKTHLCYIFIKIRNGGSAALYIAYTVYTAYIVETALHLLDSSMYAYIYC